VKTSIHVSPVTSRVTPAVTRRALPGWAVDRIHTGVSSRELRTHRASRAIYGALVSTAMSAIQAGHEWPEWHAMLTSPESRLGQQARLDGRRRDIGRARHLKNLEDAWGRAESRIAESPALTPADVSRRAGEVLAELDAADGWTATTTETDEHVYRHAVAEAERRGHTRPALPLRGIAAATGISKSAAGRSLHRLTEAGLLRLHRRGERKAESARAGIYVVPALALPTRSLPVNGSMSHLAKDYVPPRNGHCPTHEENTHV